MHVLRSFGPPPLAVVVHDFQPFILIAQSLEQRSATPFSFQLIFEDFTAVDIKGA